MSVNRSLFISLKKESQKNCRLFLENNKGLVSGRKLTQRDESQLSFLLLSSFSLIFFILFIYFSCEVKGIFKIKELIHLDEEQQAPVVHKMDSAIHRINL